MKGVFCQDEKNGVKWGRMCFICVTGEYMWDGYNVSSNTENACLCCWYVSIVRFF